MGILGNSNTLNIFTDASIKQVGQETVGCAGAFCVAGKDRTIINQTNRILRHATNNSSEITAVKLGIDLAIDYRNDFDTINLFSDSKICIYGLREWIFNWIDNMSNGVLYNSSNTEVANQEMFKKIINLITHYNLNIHLYHVKGHVNINSIKSVLNAIRVFNISNGIILPTQDMIDISDMNNYVDIFTGELLESINTNSPKLHNIMRYQIKEEQVKTTYKSLINK